MMINQSIILIVLSLGLLIVSLIVLLFAFIKEFKEKSDKFYVLIILSGIVIIFLLPIILGMIQELT